MELFKDFKISNKIIPVDTEDGAEAVLEELLKES